MKYVFLSSIVLAVALLVAGCGESSEAPAASAPATPKTPLVQKMAVADWCKEHVVPESVCTRCNASLIAAFQAKGDWCKEHSVPESQCVACHPDLKAKFEAMAPKATGG